MPRNKTNKKIAFHNLVDKCKNDEILQFVEKEKELSKKDETYNYKNIHTHLNTLFLAVCG